MYRMNLLLQTTATLTFRVDHLLQLVVDQVVRVVAFVLMEAVVLDRVPQVLSMALLVTREGLPSIPVDPMDREGLLCMIVAVNPTVRMDLPHMVVLDLMVRIRLP